jgi:hypothetical protein
VDEWNGICTIYGYLTRAGPDHVRLILLVELFGLLVVLVIREDASKDAVELGYAR